MTSARQGIYLFPRGPLASLLAVLFCCPTLLLAGTLVRVTTDSGGVGGKVLLDGQSCDLLNAAYQPCASIPAGGIVHVELGDFGLHSLVIEKPDTRGRPTRGPVVSVRASERMMLSVPVPSPFHHIPPPPPQLRFVAHSPFILRVNGEERAALQAGESLPWPLARGGTVRVEALDPQTRKVFFTGEYSEADAGDTIPIRQTYGATVVVVHFPCALYVDGVGKQRLPAGASYSHVFMSPDPVRLEFEDRWGWRYRRIISPGQGRFDVQSYTAPVAVVILVGILAVVGLLVYLVVKAVIGGVGPRPPPTTRYGEWPVFMAVRFPYLQPAGRPMHGGMAEVWPVVDARRRRSSAGRAMVKMLGSNLVAVQDMPFRFRKECEILAALQQTGVVPAVYDSCMDLRSGDGRPWYEMEDLTHAGYRCLWNKGADRIADLGRNEIRPLLRAVAMAVARVHGHGVLHRDLSPDNVMFRRSGGGIDVRIIDFGTAAGLRRVNGQGTVVKNIGKDKYSPPEFWTGDGISAADQSSDWYSIGITFWEVIAGAAPYRHWDEHRNWIGARPAMMKLLMDRCGDADLTQVIAAMFHPDRERRLAPAHIVKYFGAL